MKKETIVTTGEVHILYPTPEIRYAKRDIGGAGPDFEQLVLQQKMRIEGFKNGEYWIKEEWRDVPIEKE